MAPLPSPQRYWVSCIKICDLIHWRTGLLGSELSHVSAETCCVANFEKNLSIFGGTIAHPQLYFNFYNLLMEDEMSDLIVYAGVALLLLGVPVILAQWKSSKS